MKTPCAKGQALRNIARIALQISDTCHHHMALCLMLYYAICTLGIAMDA